MVSCRDHPAFIMGATGAVVHDLPLARVARKEICRLSAGQHFQVICPDINDIARLAWPAPARRFRSAKKPSAVSGRDDQQRY